MLSCLIVFSGCLGLVGLPFWSFYGPMVVMWEVSMGSGVSGFFLSFCLDS